jgi:hypothetical protein
LDGEHSSILDAGSRRSRGDRIERSVGASGKTGPGDNTAWLGARYRSLALSNGWSLGPLLRVALPVSGQSPNGRLELGFASSWQSAKLSWITDIGLRGATSRDTDRFAAPDRQYFLLTGVDFTPRAGISSYVMIDTHLLHYEMDQDWRARGGLTLGLESTGDLFVGSAVRLSPWELSGGRFTTQLSLGVRH